MSSGNLQQVLADAAVRSVFQPIVDLEGGRVVAYEALARGPQGPLQRPDALFAAAREQGLLAELDQACRVAAFRGAIETSLVAPLTLFVNVEPEVLDTAPVEELLAIADAAPGGLRVVVEITERALAARPAELLRTVARVRDLGWGVALDDVGADPLSLAFMPLLRPDVVKLDLRLVQERPGPAVAQIMNAVNACAEETGALVLAEGIEDERHLLTARALGARLGQGWLFGRPGPGPVDGLEHGELVLPAPVAGPDPAGSSPFALLPAGTALRRGPKPLLIEVSKHLEREALRLGETGVVAATFQEARHFTPATTGRYRDLAERVGFVCALGEGLPPVPLPGVRGATLAADDAVRGEWDVVVLGPHFAAALLARDLGSTGADAERSFEFALTYDRPTVVAAAHALLSRVVPRPLAPARPPALTRPAPTRPAAGLPAALGDLAGALTGASPAAPDGVLHRALAATGNGVSIADVRRPDEPLVYVNAAFERLAGFPAADLLGRNCRFLQGPDTDPATVAAIRRAIAAGEEWHGVVRNVRGPQRTGWWNEVHLSPVRDERGRIVQYVGVQNDVTDRVQAQRDLEVERDRSRAWAARVEELAATDALTGLPNRRRIAEQVESALWEARVAGGALALLFCDLDGFKAVNDGLGHAAGDDLLVEVAGRLRGALRRGDLLARLGGDEFIVALPGLEPARAAADAAAVADHLREAVARPVRLGGPDGPVPVRVGVSVGVGAWPADGDGFAALLHAADVAMYADKRARRGADVPAGAAVRGARD
ncbi:EAL domain-containing protein [Kineococcus sp. SYSU DK006]|uniref:EAL domain-containing protein n=1 Tax=Kineococcus sp. SYSU DK006 TaxID=3383127 RepID=UPI003D7EC1F2